MNEDAYIWSLITKKLAGEATAAELSALEELLRKQPSWQYAYEMLAGWWPLVPAESLHPQAEESYARLLDTLQLPTEAGLPATGAESAPWAGKAYRWHHLGKWLAVAGVVIVLVTAGGWLLQRGAPATGSGALKAVSGRLSEVSTHYGSKSRVTLPDGTVVWLNSGSKFTYDNKHFGQSTREVTLSGEAFFDVTHDAAHPFVIHAGKMDVTVLGTAFDVKSYPEDPTAEATLIRGSIEVSFPDHPEKRVLLEPRQKLIVLNDAHLALRRLDSLKSGTAKPYKITPVTLIPSDSTVVETSWVQNKLAFRGETFADLAVQMERWYNVTIDFSDSTVKQYRFTGVFANESLDQALKALQITAPFHYKIEKNEVYISKR